FLIEPADFFVHGGFARVAQAVLLIFFLDGLDLRCDALHLEHRLHLSYAQGEQRDGDDESLNDYGPSPVGNDVFVGPLEPKEERAREDAPPAEVDDAAEIGTVVLDGGDGNGVEDGQFFRANVQALGGWSAEAADGCAEDIDGGGV